uniref:Uncharacterized protein n=1 Tax=Anopheles darlingi TaxID=43151 RepID=A0A2M4DD93_ANODA
MLTTVLSTVLIVGYSVSALSSMALHSMALYSVPMASLESSMASMTIVMAMTTSMTLTLYANHNRNQQQDERNHKLCHDGDVTCFFSSTNNGQNEYELTYCVFCRELTNPIPAIHGLYRRLSPRHDSGDSQKKKQKARTRFGTSL